MIKAKLFINQNTMGALNPDKAEELALFLRGKVARRFQNSEADIKVIVGPGRDIISTDTDQEQEEMLDFISQCLEVWRG